MKGERNSRYISIYEQVRADIVAGRYKKGTKVPSKRVMAEANGVSVITIQHAYELLVEEGYITPVEKSGFFVSYDDGKLDGTRIFLEVELNNGVSFRQLYWADTNTFHNGAIGNEWIIKALQ